jgi:hypothetical protein
MQLMCHTRNRPKHWLSQTFVRRTCSFGTGSLRIFCAARGRSEGVRRGFQVQPGSLCLKCSPTIRPTSGPILAATSASSPLQSRRGFSALPRHSAPERSVRVAWRQRAHSVFFARFSLWSRYGLYMVCGLFRPPTAPLPPVSGGVLHPCCSVQYRQFGPGKVSPDLRCGFGGGHCQHSPPKHKPPGRIGLQRVSVSSGSFGSLVKTFSLPCPECC